LKARCAGSVREFGRAYFPNFTLLGPLHSLARGLNSAVFSGRILLEPLYNQRPIHGFGLTYPAREKARGYAQFLWGKTREGLYTAPHRPGYVRMDGIQSRKRSRSQKFVREPVGRVTQDLIPALAEGYSAAVAAAPLNTQCVAPALEKGPDETSAVKAFKYPAEGRGRTAWKDRFPGARLAKLKRAVGPTAYAQEYLLIPAALDERIFKEETLKGYAPEELIELHFAYMFSWTDPSVKYEEKHCYKAAVCAGITNGGRRSMRRRWTRRRSGRGRPFPAGRRLTSSARTRALRELCPRLLRTGLPGLTEPAQTGRN
jgi:hypothetical protein